MSNYLVSIIVPIYNKEAYLEECVNSLIKQSYTNLEILLIDDGSKDNSTALCDEYAKNDTRVKVIHKINGGLVSAWKRGVEEATGDYISFVDSDDWVDLDMVDRMIAYVSGSDKEIILSDYIIERSSGANSYVWQNIEPGIYEREQIVNDIIPKLWGYEDRVISRSRCMKLFSAKLVKENAHYGDEHLRFAEDSSLSVPCVIDAERLVFMDKAAMYHYRFVDDSMVHDYDAGLLKSIELLQTIQEQILKDKFVGEQIEKYIELSREEYIFLLMYAVKNEVRKKTDYIAGIREVCINNRDYIKNYPVQVNHFANKLIYMTMKHPYHINCILLRVMMTLKAKV